MKNLLIPILLFLMSCTTQYIISIDKNLSKNLFVDSNIKGAKIFINNKISKYTTPALIKDYYKDSINITLFSPGAKQTKDTLINLKTNMTQSITINLEKTSDTTSIQINSFPDSAECIINNKRFGYTPIKINGLEKGNYNIGLKKGNYKSEKQINLTQKTTINDSLYIFHKPLIEHFLNVSCHGCKEADEIVNKYSNKYDIIAYNANYPSKDDPFYQYNPIQISERLMNYMPHALPAIYIDGESIKYTSINDLENNITSFLSSIKNNNNISIEFLSCIQDSSNISGAIKITGHEQNSTLKINLVDVYTNFSTPPGNNSMTEFFNEFRTKKDTILETTNNYKINFDFSIANLASKNFKILAYIEKDKKIMQTNSIIP